MKSIFKRIFTIFTILIFIITIIGSVAGVFIFKRFSDSSIFISENMAPIYIYDQNDQLVSTDSLYYEYCSIKEINENLINAVIACEDKNFYNHIGISIPRIANSIYQNIKNKSIISGASTITQQYVKNTFLSSEQTLTRKLNEIVIALEIEKKYTKDQILEAYLNSVLFGGNIYGIKMASKYYFNKLPSELNINESAILAGMIQLPNYYNPFNNPDKTTERMQLVLKRMLEENYITHKQYNECFQLKTEDFINRGFTRNSISYLTPYIDYLFSSLPKNNDKIKKIKTYLDTNIQKDLYAIMQNEYDLFNDDKLNCAIVVLDNKNNGIKAIAGNRNFDKRVLSYATDALLQPGSTIKPLLDYAPAIEFLGYTPATILIDEPYSYKNGDTIKNYDNKYLGAITLRKALSDSRNIPAIKLFNEVGYKRAFSFANNLGIYNLDKIYEADAIGGATNGYTLLALTNAYQAFANLGYYKKAEAIKEIEYDLSTYKNDSVSKLVMKPSTAFLINSILHDVFKGSSFDLKKTYLMAKTGQTNYDKKTIEKYNLPSNATKDSLLIGYTKDITIGIWVGYEKNENNQYLDYNKKNIPRTIMKILLEKYALENQYYDIIDGIVKKYITIYNNEAYLAKENGYYEYFQEGNQPFSYPNYNEKI